MKSFMLGQLRAATLGTFMACIVACISVPFVFGRFGFQLAAWCGVAGLVLLLLLLLTRGKD